MARPSNVQVVDYPRPPQSDVVDTYHGVAVPDPFRTLEDDRHPATVAWVDAENALTRRTLDGPARDRIVERLGVLHRFTRTTTPKARGARRFFLENDGSRNQATLYVADGPGSPGSRRVVVDPNGLDEGGTTAVTAYEPDAEGRRVVYALSRDGSDAQELFVHDVGRSADLADRIQWAKFASIAWTGDGSAFFYTRFPEPGTVPAGQEHYRCEVRCHRLGTMQREDALVYARPDAPEVVFDVDVTADGRYLVVTSRLGATDKAEVHAIEIGADSAAAGEARGLRLSAPRALATGFERQWHFIDGRGDELFFVTDAGAPLGRIVCLALATAGPVQREIVPESADRLSLAAIGGRRLVVSSLHDAHSRLRSFALDGSDARDVPLAGIGSVVDLDGEWDRASVHIGYTSFTAPLRVLTLDVPSGRLDEIAPPPLPVDPSSYRVEQASYPSSDGTLVSLFLIRRRDVRLPAPVLMTGYGGFNISLTPVFDPSDFIWLDAGGVMVVANLRGGGEYGERWHEAGMLERKQNVFDDFIAAAEWLEAQGVANGPVAIEGGSNGGLLVAAVMLQRPERFGAVVCRVPVADMLRYHRFTVGRFWIPEYGCADDERQFDFLFKYSPLHNVHDGVAYPPTFVTTADTDDRVAPGMARKFAARLQEATSGGLVLLRVESRAGHGAGKPVGKQIEEQADIFAFLFQAGATHGPDDTRS